MSDLYAKWFMIFDVTEIDKIDFNQVWETGPETVRKTVDLTKTFVKWDTDEIPSSVQSLETKDGPYTYEQIIPILNIYPWSLPDDRLYFQ